jgi:hypothetical protein
VGDCTSWEGEIDGQKVSIQNRYRKASEIDETKTKSNDMVLKTFGSIFKAYKSYGARYLHAKGCTVSIPEHIHYLSALTGIKNPNFDTNLVFGVTLAYWQMRAKRLFNHLAGI